MLIILQPTETAFKLKQIPYNLYGVKENYKTAYLDRYIPHKFIHGQNNIKSKIEMNMEKKR